MLNDQANNIVVSFLKTSPVSLIDMLYIQPNREEYRHGDVDLDMDYVVNEVKAKSLHDHFLKNSLLLSRVGGKGSDIAKLMTLAHSCQIFSNEQRLRAAEKDKLKAIYLITHYRLVGFLNFLRSMDSNENNKLVVSNKLRGIVQDNESLDSLVGYYATLTHCSLGTSDYQILGDKLDSEINDMELKEGNNSLSSAVIELFNDYLKTINTSIDFECLVALASKLK